MTMIYFSTPGLRDEFNRELIERLARGLNGVTACQAWAAG